MTPNLNLVRDNIAATLPRYAEVMGRTMDSTLKRAFKGVTRRVIAVTQPANAGTGALTTAGEAYRTGRLRIAGQMSSLMAPVTLKRRRTITTVFGRRIPNPVTVKTTERWPDVAAVYRANSRTASGGFGIRLKARSGGKFYVSSAKFSRLLRHKQARVGVLAAGWSMAARAVDAPLPQWVARHGTSGGSVSFDLLTGRKRITARNFARGLPTPIRAELARRLPYAVAYQAAAMRREIDYMVGKRATELAIKTRNFSALVPEGMMGG